MEEVTLNRENLGDLRDPAKNPKYGVTCGRVAGRIGGARFTIGEQEYRLEANNGDACLHGGSNGFDRHEWQAEIVSDKKLSDFTTLEEGTVDSTGFSGVKFTRRSPNLEQEFPGTVDVSSWYLVNSSNQLLMIWEASTPDSTTVTPINLTNHAYWNLSGDFK